MYAKSKDSKALVKGFGRFDRVAFLVLRSEDGIELSLSTSVLRRHFKTSPSSVAAELSRRFRLQSSKDADLEGAFKLAFDLRPKGAPSLFETWGRA